MLKEKISKSRLIDHEEMQDEDIIIWEMRNDHYGVRKEARKHEKWDMKQDSVVGKFRTQNLVVTYTLN